MSIYLFQYLTVIAFIFNFLILISCGQTKKESSSAFQNAHKTSTLFKIESSTNRVPNADLKNVESILYDAINQVYYATNGHAYSEGKDGFISKIDTSGNLIDLKWVTHLNRPTGMALWGNHLYVADVQRVLIIDTNNGLILQEIASPHNNPGLNDIAINDRGRIFVSASFIHTVYELIDGEMITLLQHDTLLQWANGLWANNHELIVGGQYLCSIDLKNGSINPLNLQPLIVDFDGITSDHSGGYFLTTVSNSALWHVDARFNSRLLLKEDDYFGDLSIAASGTKLIIPRGNHERKEYYLSIIELKK